MFGFPSCSEPTLYAGPQVSSINEGAKYTLFGCGGGDGRVENCRLGSVQYKNAYLRREAERTEKERLS